MSAPTVKSLKAEVDFLSERLAKADKVVRAARGLAAAVQYTGVNWATAEYYGRITKALAAYDKGDAA